MDYSLSETLKVEIIDLALQCKLDKVAAYVNLRLAISAQAIAQRSTVMRKTHSENKLFTFRVWLVRLGLNGEEFKHTRDHLLAHLEGDRAWRHDKDSYEVNRRKKRNREAGRYPFQEEVAVICNEEGRNLDLPYNRPLMDENGLPYDIVSRAGHGR